MPYKVLHILKSGGTEFAAPARVVVPLARHMDPRRWVFFAALLQGGGPVAEELQRAGVRTEIIRWSGDRRDPVGAWRFFRYLRRERFAIVHQHFGGISGRILARAAGVRGIVLHLHSRVLENRGAAPVAYGCRVADRVIAASQAVARCASGMAQVVYSGVETPSPFPRELHTSLTVGTAARLVPLKGLAYLVEAIASLRTEFSVRLQIAGDGPEREALENLVSRLSLQDGVEFLGWRPALQEVFSRWDVFALPSLEEGFGMAALEAMAAGLPVVATDVGGLPELVQHGKTGLLVKPGDASALAGALREFALNPRWAREMGTAAAEQAHSKFSAEQMAQSIAHIYEALAH